jgi:alkylation response protein AidB-like acyl-CoA dehydrogenase
MDLDFTPEQESLRDSVRALCTRRASLASVRELENDATGYARDFWVQLNELGVLGLTIPERWGGSGMSMMDATVVYEELGRSLAPSPHFVSCVLAAGLLLKAGTDEQRAQWLPRLSSGEAIATPAWLEPGRGYGPAGVRLAAVPDGDGWLLTGTKRHVPFASVAQRLVVLARRTDGDDGVLMVLVDPHADGVTLTQQHTMAADTQYRVDLDAVRVAGTDVLAGSGWSVWHEVMLDGIILLAAQAAGGARLTLELAVDYAKTRHQFGKPLGAFQSIAHYLSDRVTEVDGAQTLVWEAAWARDHGRPIERLAPMAKLFACEAFRQTTATAQQIFGGNGFTVDFDVQLYFRRAKQLQLSFWDSRYLEGLIADAVLGPLSSPAEPGR